MKPLVATGAGLLALAVLFRARRGTDIPAIVSEAAAAQLGRALVDPCKRTGGTAAGFTELYLAQKDALIAAHGSAVEVFCPGSGVGPCVPIPSKRVPTAPADCLRKVLAQWQGIARALAAGGDFPASLKPDLAGLAAELGRIDGLVIFGQTWGSSKVDAALNGRAWSAIGRTAILLQGTLVHHGDASAEARTELRRTLTSPGAYAAVLADALGSVAGVVGRVGGEAAGQFLSSGLGSAVALGAVAYVAHRKGLL